MEDLISKWDEIKESVRIEYEVPDLSYKTWIEPLKVYGYDNNTVKILIPSDNSFALTYIVNHYVDFFKVTISEFLEGITLKVKHKNYWFD